MILFIILSIILGYLIGSLPTALILGKMTHGIDIREHGSKNLGASNAMILMGWKAGVFVALHDVVKAIIAIVLARVFFENVAYASEIAGVSCVIGHIFPFYLIRKNHLLYHLYFLLYLATE